jgi:hypothetical protein
MKRIVFLILILVVLGITPAVAQWRADLGLNIPASVGISARDVTTGETFNESTSILDVITILLPEASFSYNGSLGPVTLGGGIRGFTFLIQSFGFPYLYAEMELGPVVGQFSMGGLLFPYFGIINGVGSASVVIPDLSGYFKIGESFRIGAGVAAIMGLEAEMEAFPYIVYFSGKFVLNF